MNVIGDNHVYLNWLEDECLFSLCSRQHIFWSDNTSLQTLVELFSKDTHSHAHDFPKNLANLIASAKFAWGSPDEIIDEHTIAPLFFPFQSLEHVHALKEAMKGQSLGAIKYKLGIVTGRFGGEHPLKACHECISSDHSTVGIAYWHLSHQLPGVTTCPVHGCVLMESKDNRQWSRGFQWQLPSASTLIDARLATPTHSTLKALRNISNATVELFKLGNTVRFEPTIVAQVYREALAIQHRSRHARDGAAEGFAYHCSMLQNYPPFTALPCSHKCAIGFTSQMTRKPRGYCHPLKHLTFILWLFGSLKGFIDAYRNLATQEEVVDTYVYTTVEQIRTNAAGKVSILKRAAILKPKKMFAKFKQEVLEALASGSPKKAVCATFGISICTINRILTSNPVVKQKINEMAHKEMNQQQRDQWALTVSRNLGATATEIRNLIPSVYAWLYRNDKWWLANQTNSLPSGRRGNNVSTNWDGRDEKFCILIRKAFVNFSTYATKPRKKNFYQLVPNLYAALESKAHYAKSRALLDELTSQSS